MRYGCWGIKKKKKNTKLLICRDADYDEMGQWKYMVGQNYNDDTRNEPHLKLVETILANKTTEMILTMVIYRILEVSIRRGIHLSKQRRK